MTRKKTEPKAEQPVYLEVNEGMALIYPTWQQERWGRAGTVVRADNPLLDTHKIDHDTRVKLGLRLDEQRWKLIPAPEGAELTPCAHPRILAIYEALGYEHAAEGAPAAAGPAPQRRPSEQRTEVTVPPVTD